MSKKLEANGLWESSRMKLPEHREQIIEQNHKIKLKVKPELDEQEREIVSATIRDSYRFKQTISLKMFDPYEDLQLIGVVEKVDPQLRQFKMDGEWFRIEDIVGVERIEEGID